MRLWLIIADGDLLLLRDRLIFFVAEVTSFGSSCLVVFVTYSCAFGLFGL